MKPILISLPSLLLLATSTPKALCRERLGGRHRKPNQIAEVPIAEVQIAEVQNAEDQIAEVQIAENQIAEDQTVVPAIPVDSLTIRLTKDDFAHGTYQITQPGKYILDEDITFHPIKNCCRTDPFTQFESVGGQYPDHAYAFGFFAAITIETSGVELDLAGHRIDQSREHALLQRFFAIIELANLPFVPGQGPNDMGLDFQPGSDIYIHNGILGRSASHGIHGNGNSKVLIENVRFSGFEVAAVALNGVQGLEVRHCSATNRRDVPVLGIFSSAIFIRPYLRELIDIDSQTTLRVRGVERTASDMFLDLERSIHNVYQDVVGSDDGVIDAVTHPDEYALFHNRLGLTDGNTFGFLTNHMGVANEGFPFSSSGAEDGLEPSRDVIFKNVTVSDLVASIDEAEALRLPESGGKPVTDAIGALFQLRNVHPDTTEPVTISDLYSDEEAVYRGNVVSDAQVLVAKAALKGEITAIAAQNKIGSEIVNWIENEEKLSDLLSDLGEEGAESDWVCTTDSQANVNKGIIGFKFGGTENIRMEDCHVDGATNAGAVGSAICGDYDYSMPGARGANVRGFFSAGSQNGRLIDCSARGLESLDGMAIAFDIHTDKVTSYEF